MSSLASPTMSSWTQALRIAACGGAKMRAVAIPKYWYSTCRASTIRLFLPASLAVVFPYVNRQAAHFCARSLKHRHRNSTNTGGGFYRVGSVDAVTRMPPEFVRRLSALYSTSNSTVSVNNCTAMVATKNCNFYYLSAE